MAIVDSFPGTEKSINAPASRWVVVTPSDSVKLSEVPKAIHLGGASGAPASGTIACEGGDGVSALFFLNKGDVLPIRPHKILSTGTTASLVIIALY